MKKILSLFLALSMTVSLCACQQSQPPAEPDVEEPTPIVEAEPVEERKPDSYYQITQDSSGYYESMLFYDETYGSEAEVDAAIRRAGIDYIAVEIIVNTLNPFYTAMFETLTYLGFQTWDFQDTELIDFSIETYTEELHTTLCGRITTSEGETFKTITRVHFYSDDLIWDPISITDETLNTQYQYDFSENVLYYDESGDYWDVDNQCHSYDLPEEEVEEYGEYGDYIERSAMGWPSDANETWDNFYRQGGVFAPNAINMWTCVVSGARLLWDDGVWYYLSSSGVLYKQYRSTNYFSLDVDPFSSEAFTNPDWLYLENGGSRFSDTTPPIVEEEAAALREANMQKYLENDIRDYQNAGFTVWEEDGVWYCDTGWGILTRHEDCKWRGTISIYAITEGYYFDAYIESKGRDQFKFRYYDGKVITDSYYDHEYVINYYTYNRDPLPPELLGFVTANDPSVVYTG